jgi:hypothetical protein
MASGCSVELFGQIAMTLSTFVKYTKEEPGIEKRDADCECYFCGRTLRVHLIYI